MAQFSLYEHKGGLKPDSFHFICVHIHFVVSPGDILFFMQNIVTSRYY